MSTIVSDKMTLPYARRFTPAKPVAVISSSVWQALQAGADKAADQIASGTDSAERVRNELEFLAKAVYQRATDGKGATKTSGVAFARDLVDSLRTEFLSLLNEDRTNFI